MSFWDKVADYLFFWRSPREKRTPQLDIGLERIHDEIIESISSKLHALER